MPELPEVETVKNKLLPFVKNRKILSIDVIYPKYSCLKEIEGETILDINRKGKFFIFVLENHYMISHLRMEGKYIIRESDEILKHDLVRFNLDSCTLFYNDVRKFGVFHVFKRNEDIHNLYPLNGVGDEPFDIDANYLYESLKKKKEPIKTALLDQSIMSGLGNIYVDEVLYYSHINPYRIAQSITIEEASLIKEGSIEILNKSIKLGGSTIRSYESLNGEIGHFQGELKCHMNDGKRCLRDNDFFIKDRCGGRGTYYCPTCQKLDLSKRLVAITGIFSSGKSTVLKLISEMGYFTLSADKIYNDLYKESKEMLREIKKAFGDNTKEFLIKNVLVDEFKNDMLKEITHKYVMKEMHRLIDETDSKIVFIEVPLLFEGKLEKCFDSIITVKASGSLLESIVKSKGYTMDEYKVRVNAQMPENEKIEKSDYLILNDGSIDSLKDKIKAIIGKLEE